MKNIRINPNFQFQWEEKQNCYVLLYPEGMVQLNHSAGEILNLCDGSSDIEKINEVVSEAKANGDFVGEYFARPIMRFSK